MSHLTHQCTVHISHKLAPVYDWIKMTFESEQMLRDRLADRSRLRRSEGPAARRGSLVCLGAKQQWQCRVRRGARWT